MKPTIIDRLPRSVVALCWALAALHWRSGKKYSGATYAGISRLIGTRDRAQLFRTVRTARELGVLAVIDARNAQKKRELQIRLTHATLTQLEELWEK